MLLVPVVSVLRTSFPIAVLPNAVLPLAPADASALYPSAVLKMLALLGLETMKDAPASFATVVVEESRLKLSVPVFDIEKSVVVADCVEEPMAKSVVAVEPLLAWMERFANGVVVPRPRRALVLSQKKLE